MYKDSLVLSLFTRTAVEKNENRPICLEDINKLNKNLLRLESFVSKKKNET